MIIPSWLMRILHIKHKEITDAEKEQMIGLLDNNPKDVFDNKKLINVLDEHKEELSEMKVELIEFMKTSEFRKFQTNSNECNNKALLNYIKENHPKFLL